MGANLDQGIVDKIKKGEYVDFACLLPRDQQPEDDHRLELIYKNGQTFFMPASEQSNQNNGVSNLQKWEQAFRVFSNIYLQENPQKAIELIQYNHIISTAASSYIWENVYAYDKEFRIHQGRFLQRNWGIILQQVWMIMKDRIHNNYNNYDQNRGTGIGQPNRHKKEAC